MRRPFFCRPSGPEIVFLGIQGRRATRLPLATLFRAFGAQRPDLLQSSLIRVFGDQGRYPSTGYLLVAPSALRHPLHGWPRRLARARSGRLVQLVTPNIEHAVQPGAVILERQLGAQLEQLFFGEFLA